MHKLASVLVLLFLAPAARAETDKQVCAASYEKAQLERREARLLSARDELHTCIRVCPDAARAECGRWLGDLEKSIPSLVFEIVDGSGKPLSDVLLYVDGKLAELPKTALEIDPGVHRLRFEPAGAAPVERQISALEGQKRQLVKVVIAASAPPPAALPSSSEQPPESGIPTTSLVLGAVGVVALGSFGYFALTGLSRENEIRDSNCKPNCDEDEVADVDRSYLIADISLGIGLVALTAATVIWQSSSKSGPAVGLTLGPSPGIVGRYRF